MKRYGYYRTPDIETENVIKVPLSDQSDLCAAPANDDSGKRGSGTSKPTLTVQTAIAKPTSILIEDSEVEAYGELLKS